MTTERTGGPPFESDEDLRQYVEAELDLSVRTARPELLVEFGAREFTVVPRFTTLCWLIEDPGTGRPSAMCDRHYLLEARLEAGEFVIWFGAIHPVTAGGASPRDVVLPAVHVPFSLVHRRSRPTHDGYSLAHVLRWMLDHAERPPDAVDSMVYPMNGHRRLDRSS